MSRQINRLTEAIIRNARPREVVVPAPGIAEGPHYKVSVGKGEKAVIRPRSLRPRPDGTTSLELEMTEGRTAIEEMRFGLDRSRREYDAIIRGDDKSAAVKAQRQLRKAVSTMHDPMLVMRDGRPVLIRIKNKLYPDGGGLYLEVSGEPDGKGGISIRRSWIFRYAVPGQKVTSRTGKVRQRERGMGLGSLITVNLEEARSKARKCRQLLLDGIDPLDHKRSIRTEAALRIAKAMTFNQAMDAYVLAKGVTWRNEHHAKDWVSSLKRHVSGVFGDLPVAEVDSDLIVKALKPIWHDRTSTAMRVRGRIEKVLDFARTTGYRPMHEANPARWKGHLANILATPRSIAPPKHMEAVPWADVPALWRELEAVSSLGSKALRFNILTAVRTGELLKATASEFDLVAGTWTIPPKHNKQGREHVVPLPPAAMALVAPLLAVRTARDRVFPLGTTAMIRMLQRLRPGTTVHGTSRASFRNFVGDKLDVSREVAEACIGHLTGNVVEQAYKRTTFLEKRRVVMEAWASFVVVGTEDGDSNVVPLRA
jgi:integrase